ncbi:hypothetical protein B0H11DRAFT_2046922 [Mycena galericulata]|nr:hypothetical protein B0H11DRAFT_2046922 [Mycena galericulata]
MTPISKNSSISTLFLTNNEPTDLQAREIRRLLGHTTIELGRLEATIVNMSLVLTELKYQQQQHMDSLAALTGVISPIRRVPAEILAQIFLLCSQHSIDEDSSLIALREAPMVLTHVSSRWRAIALETPGLWRIVSLSSSCIVPPTHPLIQEIFVRSRNHPVNLTFSTYLGRTSTRYRSNASRDDLNVLWAYHERLEAVCLKLTAFELQAWTSVEHKPLPILASVSIDISAGRTAPPGTDLVELLNLFGNSPSLRSLRITATYPPDNLLTTHFPVAQLTYLSISLPIPDRYASAILMQCTQMERCHVSDILPSGEPPHTQSFHRLENLHSLSVSAANTDSSLGFFVLFSFPKLQTLHIEEVALPTSTLVDLHRRSAFELHHLKLSKVDIEFEDLLHSLRLVPTLQTLYLHDAGVVDTLFVAFTPRVPTPVISLPCLRTLAISCESNWNLDGNAIATMIEALSQCSGHQTSPFPSISSVEINLPGFKFTTDVETRLAVLRAAGFLLDSWADRRYDKLVGDDYFNDSSHSNSDADADADSDA